MYMASCSITDDWLAQVKNLYREAFTRQVFKEESSKEYLTETFQKQKRSSFVNLVQGLIIVREYTDQFEDLYKYAKDMYPTEEMKSAKFRDGLHVSLYAKSNVYAGITFRD